MNHLLGKTAGGECRQPQRWARWAADNKVIEARLPKTLGIYILPSRAQDIGKGAQDLLFVMQGFSLTLILFLKIPYSSLERLLVLLYVGVA